MTRDPGYGEETGEMKKDQDPGRKTRPENNEYGEKMTRIV